MTHQEILQKTIQKATDNGYKPTNFVWIPEDKQALLDYWFTADNYKAVIFNHGFAKALWGDTEGKLELLPDDPSQPDLKMWEYRLQRMVVSDDPIRYLGEHI